MIQFKVGQEVYHTRFGRGVIQSISDDDPPIISVDFAEEKKELVYDKNLLLRMTIRGAKNAPKGKEESESVQVSINNNTGINQGKAPTKIIQIDGYMKFVCPTCGSSFVKAKRCPDCGQLILNNADASPKPKKRILHVGDDVSRLRIYEIINKYFGENYSGWMKASYEINSKYWAWFPTITKTSSRPNGNYGGTVMWSNVLSTDRKTILSVNHDEPNKAPKEQNSTSRSLVFARIDGVMYFLGVFENHHVPNAEKLTFRNDRIAQGIDLDTFQLIDED